MLLVYYNPNKDNFYIRYTRNYFTDEYYLGKINEYGHILVQLFLYDDNELVPIEDYWSYYQSTKELKPGFKVRLINRVIYLLNRIKK